MDFDSRRLGKGVREMEEIMGAGKSADANWPGFRLLAKRSQIALLAIGLALSSGICGCREPAVDQDQKAAASRVTSPKTDDQDAVQAGQLPTGPAQDPKDTSRDVKVADSDPVVEFVEPVFPQELVNPKWKRMDPVAELWIDFDIRRVVVGGRICFREGYLEMFACPAGTKEHESVVAVNSSAKLVHACLLALGAEPGTTVSWDPEYKPATGPVIDIEVHWMANGKEEIRNARDMVLDMNTNKTMTQEWVFGGSREFTESVTGAEFYAGDGGEFVCLSNFTTATIDIPVPSSDSVGSLMFAANSENIPDLEHRVLMFLKPRIAAKEIAEVPNQAPESKPAVATETGAGKSGAQN